MPTGGTAEGRADLLLASGSETYFFHAERKDASPVAKGKFSGTITETFGTTTFVITIEAKLDCLAILGQPAGPTEPAGTNAFLSGPITKLVENGQPIDPHGENIFFRVLAVDDAANSKTGGDLASQIYGSPPQGCQSLVKVPVTPKARVEVKPD